MENYCIGIIYCRIYLNYQFSIFFYVELSDFQHKIKLFIIPNMTISTHVNVHLFLCKIYIFGQKVLYFMVFIL